MTRRLTLPHGLAGLQPDGTLWVVMSGTCPHNVLPCGGADCCCVHQPPAVLLALAAPCETCYGHKQIADCDCQGVVCLRHITPCPDCRIELVGESPTCDGEGCYDGTVTLGYAYPVGGVQEVWRQDVPQRGTSWLLLCHTLGMDAEVVSALVGQYALKLAVTPCSAAT